MASHFIRHAAPTVTNPRQSPAICGKVILDPARSDSQKGRRPHFGPVKDHNGSDNMLMCWMRLQTTPD